MLFLASTNDVLRVITDAACSIDVQASFVDLSAGTPAPGVQRTKISTATTTTVVSAPASSTTRNIKALSIRNTHASTSVGIGVQVFDGTNAYEIEAAVLAPGQSAVFFDGQWFTQSSAVTPDQAWETRAIATFGANDSSPATALLHLQRGGNVAATPTNITTSVARCSLFRPRRTIVVDSVYMYGVGLTTNVFRCAIYRYSDHARLTSELAFSTAVNTWGVVTSGLNLTLSAGVLYYMACSVNATGTTAGPACIGGTVAATTGQIATAPGSLPNNLAPGLGFLDGYFFQFAVTTGALPATAPTPAAQAAWTGGMPAFFLTSL